MTNARRAASNGDDPGGSAALQMTGGPNELSDRERDLLRTFEDEISRAEQRHYRSLGRCFRAIRDGGLYRHVGTWEASCRRRWSRSKQDVDRKIKALEVAEELERESMRPPMTERQARPLGPLTTRLRREAARRVESEGGWRYMSAKRVEQIAKDVTPSRPPPRSSRKNERWCLCPVGGR